jgi:hypothetical protein
MRLGHSVCGRSMKFPYTLNIVPSLDTGEEIVLLRPEIPLRIFGPAGHVDVLALVDSGADNSIMPLSIAKHLGITTTPGKGPGAMAFGGERIALALAEVILELEQDDDKVRWRARIYFADVPHEKAVILGHEGFLDYFTATFRGEDCVLDLQPGDSIPRV